MRRAKRVLAVAVALTMGLTMVGCKGGSPSEGSTEPVSKEEEITEVFGDNLIKNGDFNDGLTNWTIYTKGGEAQQLVTDDGEMEIKVSNPGTLDYAIQPYYDGFSLDSGCEYQYSFDVHSTVERTLQWRLQLNGGDYHAYVSDIVTVNEEVQHVTCTFKMEEASDPAPRLCINMGMVEGCPEDLGEHSVYFDNFALYMTDDSGKTESKTEVETSDINVNQIGYLPSEEKKAVVRQDGGDAITGSFDVVDQDGKTVYTGELQDAKANPSSKEQTAIADFTEVTEPGTYKIVTADYGESFSFEIGEDVYDAVSDSVLHMFYLQRCGTEVQDDAFGHAACHTDGAIAYGSASSAFTEVLGGWHDAGDYGRYVVPGAKAAADLMLAYESYGDQFGDDIGIPESGNDTPDILDEVKYELDWMLQMQDTESGGVYHKITGENFPDTVMPEEETAQMYLAPISTTATADFAATMAMAARVFHDEAAGQVYLDAAKKAWAYLEVTPGDGVGFKNPTGIVTGEYDDTNDTDERYWALAELYKTTQDETYLNALKGYSAEEIGTGLGWQNVGLYGMYAYLTSGSSDDYYASVKAQFDNAVETAYEKYEKDSYGVSLGTSDYTWGSNMNVANNGMLFLMANQLEANPDYVKAANAQVDYLMGTNTNSYCFITGFGTLSPVNPHHRPSQAVGQAMSGMLIGGPDSNLEDPYAKATLVGKAPATCYVDSVQSYSCNEITIYWNSPLVYLLAGVEAK